MERKQFDREFKAQAVRMCEQGDVPIAQVARELGINVKLLYRWRNLSAQRHHQTDYRVKMSA